MSTQPKKETAASSLRMIPTKWAVLVLGVVITYVVLQPRLNQWFGWSLPSVGSMVGDEKPVAKKPPPTPSKSEASRKSTKDQLDKVGQTEPVDQTEPVETKESAGLSSRQNDDTKTRTPTKTTSKPNGDSNKDESDPLYGFLTEVGRNRYESPAGLVYGPGSEEGHRLKHIARHLEDQPDRPGSHGVFKGKMKAFLVTIDDAYQRAKKGAKGTTKKPDDGSMVYEVTFEKAIGFIGGEAGGRKKNPSTKKIRLVVRGENVITAFPF